LTTLYGEVKFYFINPFLGDDVVPYASLGAGTNLKSLPQRQHYEMTDSCSLWVEAGRHINIYLLLLIPLLEWSPSMSEFVY
jgi:hypothetical protein